MITAPTTGWYYLLGNGDLAYKTDSPGVVDELQKNSLIVGLWPFNGEREVSWTILVEAMAAGAAQEKIYWLAYKWNCDDADALIYSMKIGVELIRISHHQWCARPRTVTDLKASPYCAGYTALEALAILAKELGYQPSKLWGESFQDLLQKVAS